MSTFYINRSSGESANSQWIRYLQTQSYVSDIGEIVSQNRKDLQATLNTASAEQKQAFKQICGTLDEGFSEVSQHLQNINCNISELRGEICAMAAMLDWNLSLLIEEQRLTNHLLGHIAQLLRIPDSQKQRVYHIEQGLKYLTNAMREGLDSAFYADALEGFKEAERIERKDYITLNRIGQIHLYSRQHMNIPLAEEYFLKSAREAFAEANVGGTPIARDIAPEGNQPLIYSTSPFKAATAEAYLYAGRACYLQQKLPQAVEYAGKAYSLVPEFLKAGFEQAKYLAANNQDDESAAILQTVINKDRLFAPTTLKDSDLISKKSILNLLADIQTKTILLAKQELGRCKDIIRSDSEARKIIEEAERHLSINSFLSAMKALDMLTAQYQLPCKEYRKESGVGYVTMYIVWQTVTSSQTVVDFITKENQSALQLEKLRGVVLQANIISWSKHVAGWGTAIGFVVGFINSCTTVMSRGGPKLDLSELFATMLVCGMLGAGIGAIVGAMKEPYKGD